MRDEHPLDVWLAKRGKTRVWLASKLDISTASLSRIISGKQWAGREFFITIDKLTDSAITPNDFLPSRSRSAA